jgi:hypothetical protein
VVAGLALVVPLAATASTTTSDVIHTFLGDGNTVTLDSPSTMVPYPGGGYLVVDTNNNRIQKVAPDGTTTTVAGTMFAGYDGDNQPAVDASLDHPLGVAITPDGGFLIADTGNQRVRKVAADGTITTVAGDGTQGQGLLGSLLAGILGTSTPLDTPSAVAVTPDGGFLIADTGNNVIQKVDTSGNIGVVAGTGTGGYSGDGGDAAAAQLCSPRDVEPTSDGGFLIADTGNNVIRKVASDGTITTVAGDTDQGYDGDNGDATLADLNAPQGVAEKSDGSIWIADTGNNVIRRVKNGTIKTKIGDGTAQFAGDEGDAKNASLDAPEDVLFDGDATYVADTGNDRIRQVVTETVDDGQGDDNQGNDDSQGDDSGGGSHGGIVGSIAGNSGPGSSHLPEVKPPTVGKDFEVEHQGGTVTVKVPGSDKYVTLSGNASIPMGSIVNVLKGKVTLTSAKDSKGTPQSATFHGGIFKVTQKRAKTPITELQMRGGDFSVCHSKSRASSAQVFASRKRRARKVRHLWGSGHGHFRTRGRHGAATVRGTIWLTEDSCAGTRVTVRRGLVAVRDFKRHRTVMVPKHHSYLARVHPLHKHR